MKKMYAAVMGQSKENKIGAKIDFYQVVFWYGKAECERAVKGGWCLAYTSQKEIDNWTLNELEKKIHKNESRKGWWLDWRVTPYGHWGYVVVSAIDELIY